MVGLGAKKTLELRPFIKLGKRRHGGAFGYEFIGLFILFFLGFSFGIGNSTGAAIFYGRVCCSFVPFGPAIDGVLFGLFLVIAVSVYLA